MTAAPVLPGLVLHLGAHRTGSTAVERCLALNRRRLRRAGVALWNSGEMRRRDGFPGLAGLDRRARAGDAEAAAELGRVAEGLRADMAALGAKGIGRLVVSEENILGDMERNLTQGALYPGAFTRLAAHAAALPQPARVGIGIRGYEDYWVSAYLFVLHRRPLRPFAEIAGALAAAPRGWLDLLRAVRRAFPRCEILVWRQERLAGRVAAVAARLAGLDPATPLVEPEGVTNPRKLAVRDIPAVERLRAAEPGLAGPALRAALAGAREAAPEPALFTPAQSRAMAERYAADVAELAGGHLGARLIGEAA